MTENAFVANYRHTQYARWVIYLVLGLVALFVISRPAPPSPFLVVVPIVLIAAWLFHSLTIEIAEGELRWRFGPGLIRKSVPLAEIVSAEPVRTNFLSGWGIHLSRFGWLYNVSGFDAVAITLRSGRRFALGTDEPLQLSARLKEINLPNT